MSRIMIVDDEPYIIKSIKTVLERHGYEVTGAQSGAQCLEKLEKESGKFDLILMDFFMPEMNGREVIEKIRENPRLKDTKIAFLTAAGFRDRGMEVLRELNISGYIMKPIEIHGFSEKIKKILSEN